MGIENRISRDTGAKRAKRILRFCATLAGVVTGVLIGAQVSRAFADTEAQFAVGPDSNQELLLQTIHSAQDSLKINMYEFKYHKIKDALIERIQAGVTVELLIEGEPVGGAAKDELDILEDLRVAMKKSGNKANVIYVMTNMKNQNTAGTGYADVDRTGRRFVFNHAKYMIIDGQRAWVASENFSKGGHTDSGTYGNRGWDVVVSDLKQVAELERLFTEDSDRGYGDVQKVGPTKPIPLTIAPNSQSSSNPGATGGKRRTVKPFGISKGMLTSMRMITSPNSAEEISRLIRSADQTVEVEQMSLPHEWRDDSGKVYIAPVVEELVKTARRGVKVRVLLNDPDAFSSAKPGSGDTGTPPNPKAFPANVKTVNYLNQIAKAEKLKLEAKIIDTTETEISYIHNKGILVDGLEAFVSSINGTRNSMESNREVGLVVKGRDAGLYYTKVFDFDWTRSPKPPKSQKIHSLVELSTFRFLP